MELSLFGKTVYKSKVSAADISDWKSALYNDGHMYPYNPDKLVLKKGGLDVYRDMMRLDEQIKACMMTKINMIFASGYKFEPSSEDKQDKEVAEFVEYALGDGMIYFQRGKRINAFRKSLKKIFTALPFGFSVTEKIFQKFTEGQYAGKIGIHALKTRPPHSFEFEIDKHNNLKFIRQHGHDSTIIIDDKELPYFIIYSHDADNTSFDSYYGVSDLRAAYRHYWSKEIIIRFRNIYLERFGMGIVMGKYPRGMSTSEQNDLKDMIKNITAKTAFKIPKDVEIAILESKSKGEAGYNDTIEHCNKMIARALLVPDLLGYSETSGGSYSLGKNHFDLFVSILTELQTDCEEIVNEQIIKDLVDYNFANIKGYPRFVFNPLTQKDKENMAEIFLKAVNEGVVLPTEEDEGYMRESLDFPQRSENSVLLPKKEPAINPIGVDPENNGEDNNDDSVPPKSGNSTKSKSKGTGSVDDEVNARIKEDNEDAKQTKFEFKLTREVTTYELKLDLNKIYKDQVNTEKKLGTDVSRVMMKAKDDLISRVKSRKIIEDKKYDEVNKMNIRFMDELKLSFKGLVRGAFELGKTHALKELPRKYAKSAINWALPPKEALASMESKSFWLAGSEADWINNKVKPILYEGIRSGKTNTEVIYDLEELFQQYEVIQQQSIWGRIVEKPVEDIPGRIEVITRTNFNEAYNQGKIATYNDPDLAGFVVAMQYSAIMDGRISAICESLDGKVWKIDNPVWKNFVPPMHHNCRSMIVSVFADEFNKESNAPKVDLLPGFGG